MASETPFKVACAEACYLIASLLNKILYNDNNKHPLPATECNTDSTQLHEATLSIQPILDKRLIIHIALLRKMIEKKDIKNKQKIGFIPPHNLQIP